MKKLSILFLILLLYSCGSNEIYVSGASKQVPTKRELNVPRMTKEDLKALLDDPDSGVIILDIRSRSSWRKSTTKITSAMREDPNDFNSWAEKHPQDKPIVLYCAGHDEGTSARLALKLIDKGYSKVYALKGGWDEWLKVKYPTERK